MASLSASGPAKRAEWTPGAPPSASTSSPVSSARDGQAGVGVQRGGFLLRVAFERRRVLLHLRRALHLGRAHEFDGEVGEEGAELGDFAGIAGGEDDAHGTGRMRWRGARR